MKAVSTSLAVTIRSLRMPARCSSCQSMTSVSDAEGRSRGLTLPVRARTSPTATSASTMAIRAAVSPSEPAIVVYSELGWNWLELGREDVRRRRQVFHAAEFGQVERQLQLFQGV